MPDLDRRSVLELAAAGSLASALALPATAQTPAPTILLEESGTIRADEPFVLAALATADLARFEQDIAPTFVRHQFRIELRYRSTVKYKVPVCREIIGIVSGGSAVRIVADVLLPSANRAWPTDPDQSGEMLKRAYTRLLSRAAPKAQGIVLHRKRRFARERAILAAVAQAFPAPGHVEETDPRSRAAQFLNVACGSIYRYTVSPVPDGDQYKAAVADMLRKAVSAASSSRGTPWDVRSYASLTL